MNKRRVSLFAALPLAASLLILVVWSCGESRQQHALQTTVDTVDGVVYVFNSGSTSTWTLRPVATIGSEVGHEAFGRVRSVLLDDDGGVFVGDELEHHIKVFDPLGQYVRTIGREGAGPGEFTRVWSLAWVGDTLAVLDPDAARIGLLTPGGEWIGLWRSQRYCCWGIRLYRASAMEFYARQWRAEGEIYVRYTQAGAIDTFPQPISQQHLIGGPSCELQGGGISAFAVPFGPNFLHAPAPDGTIATILTDRYRFAFITTAGDTVRIVEREYANLPISDAEWQEGTASFRDFLETWGRGSRCNPKEQQRPQTKPAVRSFFFDPNGRLWVEVYTTAGFAFEVFDEEGLLVGTVDLPERDESVEPHVRSGRLVLVEKDSLDIQYVRVFEILN